MKHYKTLIELHKDNGWEAPQHSLISSIDHESGTVFGEKLFTCDAFVVVLKSIVSQHNLYGRTQYDHDNGTMFFKKPREVIKMNEIAFAEKGFLLLIHEDFLNGNELQKGIQNFSFFDYNSSEAIHLSPREEKIIWELHHKINIEYLNNPDEFTRDIILSHAASLLKYMQRFYKRQFIDRKEFSIKIISTFYNTLKLYLKNGKLQSQGLPTVSFLAEQQALSPGYLSDTLQQELGRTALELIYLFFISEAKELLRKSDKGVDEIANSLGFNDTVSFIQLFKKQTGMKPLEFKKINLN